MAVCHAHYAAAIHDHAYCSWCNGAHASRGIQCCKAAYTQFSSSIFVAHAQGDRALRRVLAPFVVNRLHVIPDSLLQSDGIVEGQEGDCTGRRQSTRVQGAVCSTEQVLVSESQNGAASPSGFQIPAAPLEGQKDSGKVKRKHDIEAMIAPTLAGTKVCSSCREEKVIGDFREFRTSADGRSYQVSFLFENIQNVK